MLLSSLLMGALAPAHAQDRAYHSAPKAVPASLEERIAEARDLSRFVPERSLQLLHALEPEARAASPDLHAEFLSQLCIATMFTGEHAGALQIAEELIAYAKQQKNDAALAKGWLAKGFVMFAMAERKGAHQLMFNAERLADTTNDLRGQVLAKIASGQSSAEEGNYPVALTKLQTAVDLARKLETPGTLFSALNALAVLFDQMKQYQNGFEAIEESIALAEQMHSPGRVAVAKNIEYGLATDSGQMQRARKSMLMALQINRQIGAKALIARNLVNMSDSYLKERNYARALDFGMQALAAAQLSKDGVAQAVSQSNIGQSQLGLGRVSEGKKSLEAALAYYEKTGDKPELQSILLEYGGALERVGDLSGALRAYHRERELSNELFELQRQKSVYELQEKYETDKKERQIELLSRENQVKGAEIDNRRLQQRVWWLLAVVAALAAMVVGLLYRKVRHANTQLEEKNLELKQQSARDPLTALYNRRHFQEFMRSHNQLPPQVKTSGKGSEDDIVGALLLLDVDHFKHVNDRYGHTAGDVVLKMIAATLHDVLRETDMIVRWGGEEFLAFLPAVPRRGVDDIARRVLEGISSQTIQYQEHTISVNVSIGFAPFPLAPGDTPLPWERAVNLVDMALYLAKAHGRNRAYGVRGFERFEQTSMEAIEQDLERAWQDGYVDLSVVLGDGPPAVPPNSTANSTANSNVVTLKRAGATGRH